MAETKLIMHHLNGYEIVDEYARNWIQAEINKNHKWNTITVTTSPSSFQSNNLPQAGQIFTINWIVSGVIPSSNAPEDWKKTVTVKLAPNVVFEDDSTDDKVIELIEDAKGNLTGTIKVKYTTAVTAEATLATVSFTDAIKDTTTTKEIVGSAKFVITQYVPDVTISVYAAEVNSISSIEALGTPTWTYSGAAADILAKSGLSATNGIKVPWAPKDAEDSYVWIGLPKELGTSTSLAFYLQNTIAPTTMRDPVLLDNINYYCSINQLAAEDGTMLIKIIKQ